MAEKLIKDLKVGEEVWFGHYRHPFKVVEVKPDGFAKAVLKNEFTKLTLRGNFHVRTEYDYPKRARREEVFKTDL